jgi:chromosome segregation ATPase
MYILHSLQSSVELYHQLQKDYEDLKDARSTAEACVVVLKLRVQQLEKEAQTLEQQLSKLDSQVLCLHDEKPLY